MIGGAFLLVGLLLVITGLISPRLGGALDASPSSVSGAQTGPEGARGGLLDPRWVTQPARTFLLSPFDAASWRALAAILVGFFVGVFSFTFMVGFLSGGMSLLWAGIGVVFIGVAIELARIVARFERRRAGWADRRPLAAHQYRRPGNSLRETAIAIFADVSRWRDVLYVIVSMPLTIIEFVVALSAWTGALVLATSPFWYELGPGFGVAPGAFAGRDVSLVALLGLVGLALIPVAASITQGLMALHRAVVAGLLCVSERRELERRVATLTESRSAILDVEASELRRIERDLHDGAQQRLVMLTIDLSLAADRIEKDPVAARKLVDDAREQARQALAELRDLVRGIAPAILLDRGLVAALSAIAGRCTVPTTVDSRLPDGARLPVAIERGAYFVVAEALANVAKHSAAKHCEIRCRDEAGRLVVEVWDDGRGGATVGPAGGLAGLVGRVEALDGKLTVSSPEGGPTVLRAELPIGVAAPEPAGPQPVVSGWVAPSGRGARRR